MGKAKVKTNQEIPDMTNDEIWQMLENKMLKNGLNMSCCSAGEYLSFSFYCPNDVHNAIALAYKVGYLRAMKGRPFKFGEKNSGHWKPVDPNNLPKEGTKVRYARKYKDYTDDIIMIGDTGVVKFEGVFNPKWFGMKLDKPRKSIFGWVDFSTEGNASCLDMWVEDDE